MKINDFRTKQFLARIKYDKLPPPQQEYHIYIRGHVKGERPHRIDFAWPNPIKLAIEVEGGIYTFGRHTRGSGYEKDMKKYNWISRNGWVLLRYTWQNIDYNEIKEVYDELSTKRNM